MAATFAQIESERLKRGVSANALCAAAGIPFSTYWRASKGRHAPYPGTLDKLSAALVGSAKPRVPTPDDRLRTLFRAYAAILAPEFTADPAVVVDSDPGQRANADPVWALAAKVRAIAVYCVVIELDVPAARVAAAIGVTRQAASSMLRRVEDLRDECPDIDALVERVGVLVSGRAA